MSEAELRSELLRRTRMDTDARNAMIQWMKDHGTADVGGKAILGKDEKAEFERFTAMVKRVDEDNTKWLKGVVEMHGWPTNTLVGKDGASAAWLLVQHASTDRTFQRQCLDLMAKLPKDEVSPANVAYLTDRVLLYEVKKQVYGTQTQFSPVDGKLKPAPLEDEANVDQRRAEVGLQPLAEYCTLIEQLYGVGPKEG